MRYPDCISGEFISRPNRFIAQVRTGDAIETVHVKNTGRCRELLLPGSRVTLAASGNPNRKTKYDLISVYKDGLGWVNIDSQIPNALVLDWLKQGSTPFPDLTLLRPEYTFGESRIDFYLKCEGGRKILMEVKGCTLERQRQGWFPDAPTARGTKHLRELTRAVADGWECCIAFVIAMPGVVSVLPNRETDPGFAEAFDLARESGVKTLLLPCSVQPDAIEITGWQLLP